MMVGDEFVRVSTLATSLLLYLEDEDENQDFDVALLRIRRDGIKSCERGRYSFKTKILISLGYSLDEDISLPQFSFSPKKSFSEWSRPELTRIFPLLQGGFQRCRISHKRKCEQYGSDSSPDTTSSLGQSNLCIW